MAEDLRKELIAALDDPINLLEPEIKYIHSGNYALNWLLCGKFFGGWPIGSFCETYGDPSTGKSLVIDQAGAEMQRAGGIYFLDDSEDARDDTNMSRLGVNLDKSQFRKQIPPSNTIHDCFVNAAIITRKIKFAVPYLYATDSLSVIASKFSMGEDGYSEDQGRKAKEIRGGMAFLRQAIHETEEVCGRKNSGIYLISRHAIANPQLHGKKTATGGNAPAFESTIRLLMEHPTPWPKNNPRGVLINVRIIKSRIRYANEGAQGWFFVDWEYGVHPQSGILQLLAAKGWAKDLKNGWFEVPGFSKNLGISNIGNQDIWEQVQEYLRSIDNGDN